MKIVIVGGGAAGFFAAIRAAELWPHGQVVILEKSDKVLSKVKISGGGRCNVTHACFDPRELVRFYPRGGRELLGPFFRFQPADTMEWFSDRGVELKVEEDFRVFPVTDKSQTIIDCFEKEVGRLGVEVKLHAGMRGLQQSGSSWEIHLQNEERIAADAVIMTTGSSPQVWKMLSGLGHRIIEPVPSLFTFNIRDARIAGLPGLSVPRARVTLTGDHEESEGPLLITHWGLSGPAILKISAFAARELARAAYRFNIRVDWDAQEHPEETIERLRRLRTEQPKKTVGAFSPVEVPQRLWYALTEQVMDPSVRWADVSNKQLQLLSAELHGSAFQVEGKSTFKEEFVTAGGVDLREVDFRTMESKVCPGLYFAGEVLDIDAVTGGFNFQAAWTTGWIAGGLGS